MFDFPIFSNFNDLYFKIKYYLNPLKHMYLFISLYKNIY